MVEGELQVGGRTAHHHVGALGCPSVQLPALDGDPVVFDGHHPARSDVRALQGHGPPRPPARSVAARDEHVEHLVDAVLGQIRGDGCTGAARGLGVVAVHGQLVRAATGDEPGRVVGVEPGPHLGAGRGGVELLDEMPGQRRHPGAQFVAPGRLGERGLRPPGALAQHMAPEPAELADVDGEIGDLPTFAGRHEIIGRGIFDGHGQGLALGPDRFDEGGVVHRPNVPRCRPVRWGQPLALARSRRAITLRARVSSAPSKIERTRASTK